MSNLPIDPIILKKRMAIPTLIAELSYINQDEAIRYIRLWGEKKVAITIIYDQLNEILSETKHSF